MTEQYQLCKVLDLVSAIFALPPEERDQLRAKYGVPETKKRECSVCGQRLSLYQQNKTGLCRKHYFESKHIQVSCSQCGQLFDRRAKEITWRTQRGYQHFFCNPHCFGKWSGIHYGFRAHPENAVFGNKINMKHNHAAIWQTHLETGFGCRRLSALLDIPESTITYILRRMRDEPKATPPNLGA